VIVGSAAYMSPEQADAQPVDARSDIFSFGCVLYEMATGRRAFSGESVLSTLSAVLRDEPPPVQDIARDTPRELARIIGRCLRKDPARRFQGMADLRVALEDCRDEAEAPRPGGAVQPSVTPRRIVRPWATLAMTALGVVLGAACTYIFWPANAPAAIMRAFVTESSVSESPAWSPDGKTLAYVAHGDNDSRLMARALDAASPAQLAVARGFVYNLLWSRDATRIFYLSRTRLAPPSLWSVGAAGGAPRKERDVVSAIDISPDGRTFAVAEMHHGHGELWLGALDGSARHRYNVAPFNDSWHYLGSPGSGQIWIRFAPDGSKFLVTFTPVGGGNDADAGNLHNEIWSVPYPTGKPKRVLSEFIGSSTLQDVQWMPDSRHLVLTVVSELGGSHVFLADVRSGNAVSLTSTTLAEGGLSVRPGGKSIAFESLTRSADLIEVPLDGGPVHPMLDSTLLEHSGAWSPDGSTYAYVLGQVEIWLRRSVEGWARPLVRIGEGGLPGTTRALRSIRFSPDANRILFTVIENKHQIYIASVAGGKPVPLEPGNPDQHYADWSPDGEWVVYTRRTSGPPIKDQLVKIRSGGGQPVVIADNVPVTAIPAWSPSGDWIAYTSRSLHLISPDGTRHKDFDEQTCRDIGFARDGSSLFCIAPSHEVFSIDVSTGHARKLLEVPLPSGAQLEGFSLHPKGTGFLTTLRRMKSDIWVLEGFPTVIRGPARWLPWLFGKP
jgi:Tol biopolymer transport system component